MTIESSAKVAATIIAISGFLFGVWKFAEESERGFRKPYWEKSISLYFEATSATATIASTTDETERSAAINDFWRLYWGPLVLVEDNQVSAEMIKYGNCLKNDCSPADLKRLSFSLAKAARQSLAETWNVRLDELVVK